MSKTPHDNYKFRAIAGADIGKWRSFWITTKRFRPLEYKRLFDAHGASEYNTKDNNIHTLFRKNFKTRSEKIEKALLYISADDIYKVYINGDFIGNYAKTEGSTVRWL